jgi:pimeloyl-ACP methyl ester carboxylesterase
LPTVVVWGESDRIVDPEYGRAYAAAIPSASFVLLGETGHLPQLETPEKLLTAIVRQ